MQDLHRRFQRVELRVARIVEAEHVEGADKLLKLTVDLGTTAPSICGNQIGLRPVQAERTPDGRGRQPAPRKMRFGESQGMILAASGDGPGIFLLSPDEGAEPGMRVK